jgi:hypothetical protein
MSKDFRDDDIQRFLPVTFCFVESVDIARVWVGEGRDKFATYRNLAALRL